MVLWKEVYNATETLRNFRGRDGKGKPGKGDLEGHKVYERIDVDYISKITSTSKTGKKVTRYRVVGTGVATNSSLSAPIKATEVEDYAKQHKLKIVPKQKERKAPTKKLESCETRLATCRAKLADKPRTAKPKGRPKGTKNKPKPKAKPKAKAKAKAKGKGKGRGRPKKN